MINMITNILAPVEYNIILSSEIITGIQRRFSPSLSITILTTTNNYIKLGFLNTH